MKWKPWPIVLISIFLITEPLVKVFLDSFLFQVNVDRFLGIYFETHNPFESFVYFLSLPIAGVALFVIKRWSLPLFFTMELLVGYDYFVRYSQVPGENTMFLVFGILALNLAIVSYFLIPAVWEIYYNPRLRWWESKPRFRVVIPATLEGTWDSAPCTIVDISEGGAYIQTKKKIELNKPVTLVIKLFEAELKIAGEAIHFGDCQLNGVGMRFIEKNPEINRQIEKFMEGVRLLNAQEIRPRGKWHEDFKNWINILRKDVKKGLIPESNISRSNDQSDPKDPNSKAA